MNTPQYDYPDTSPKDGALLRGVSSAALVVASLVIGFQQQLWSKSWLILTSMIGGFSFEWEGAVALNVLGISLLMAVVFAGAGAVIYPDAKQFIAVFKHRNRSMDDQGSLFIMALAPSFYLLGAAIALAGIASIVTAIVFWLVALIIYIVYASVVMYFLILFLGAVFGDDEPSSSNAVVREMRRQERRRRRRNWGLVHGAIAGKLVYDIWNIDKRIKR